MSAQSAASPEVRMTRDRDTLWNLSTDLLRRYPGATRAQIMVALLRANPDVFVQGNLHRLRTGRPLTLPSTAAVLGESVPVSAQLVQQHLVALTTSQPPLSLPAWSASAPAPKGVAAASASSGVTGVSEARAPEVRASAAGGVPASPEVSGGASSPVAAASVLEAPAPVVRTGSEWWWPVGLGGLALVGGWLLWRQRSRGPAGALSPQQIQREAARSPSGPASAILRQQVISNAAADMARAVEAARADHVMVTPVDGSALLPPTARRQLLGPDEQELQVDIVRTWMELERWDDARQLLAAMEAQPLSDARRSTLEDLRSRLPLQKAA